MGFKPFMMRPALAQNILMNAVIDSEGKCFGADLIGKRQEDRNVFAKWFKKVGGNFSGGWGFDWQNEHMRYLHHHSAGVVCTVQEADVPLYLLDAIIQTAERHFHATLPHGIASYPSLDELGYRALVEAHFFEWIFIPGLLGRNALKVFGAKTAYDIVSSFPTGTPGLGDAFKTLHDTRKGMQEGFSGMYDLGTQVVGNLMQKDAAKKINPMMVCSNKSYKISENSLIWSIPHIKSEYKITTGGRIRPGDIGQVNSPISSVHVVTSPTGGSWQMQGWGSAVVVSMTPIRLARFSRGSYDSGDVRVCKFSHVMAGEANLRREALWEENLRGRDSNVVNPKESRRMPAYKIGAEQKGNIVSPPRLTAIPEGQMEDTIHFTTWGTWSR